MEAKGYIEYCTGCGLCKSVLGVEFAEDNKGYGSPELSVSTLEFCASVCPAGGRASEKQIGRAHV